MVSLSSARAVHSKYLYCLLPRCVLEDKNRFLWVLFSKYGQREPNILIRWTRKQSLRTRRVFSDRLPFSRKFNTNLRKQGPFENLLSRAEGSSGAGHFWGRGFLMTSHVGASARVRRIREAASRCRGCSDRCVRSGVLSRSSSRLAVCFLIAWACRGSLHGVFAASMQSAARGMQREVGEDNKGFQMLRKMGWRSGAIGQSQDGLIEPIDPLANRNAHTSPRKSGLGTSPDFFSGAAGGGNRKQRRASGRGMDASSPTFVSPRAATNRKQQRGQELQVVVVLWKLAACTYLREQERSNAWREGECANESKSARCQRDHAHDPYSSTTCILVCYCA